MLLILLSRQFSDLGCAGIALGVSGRDFFFWRGVIPIDPRCLDVSESGVHSRLYYRIEKVTGPSACLRRTSPCVHYAVSS
jgi:hypothetical protein